MYNTHTEVLCICNLWTQKMVHTMMASARLRSMTLCPNLFHFISTYMEMTNHQQTPTIIASNSDHCCLSIATRPPRDPSDFSDRPRIRCSPSWRIEGTKLRLHPPDETVEYASTCPRKNLEDCGALQHLGDNGSKWHQKGIWSQVSSGRMIIIHNVCVYKYILTYLSICLFVQK